MSRGARGVALVTGGSGAIGATTVRMLASRGSKVAFTYLSNEEAAAELITEARERRRQRLTRRAGVSCT
jgi:3-oxoacyl-[acyl-carrier protein] reductase